MANDLNQDGIQSSSSIDGNLRVRRDLEISIPSPESDRLMSIRCADWNMLQRRLTAASDSPKDYSTLYGTLFGLSGSAFITLIPIGMTKDLPSWIIPAYWIFAFAFLFCGIFTVIISRDQRKLRKTAMTNLLEDFKEISERYTLTSIQGEQIIG